MTYFVFQVAWKEKLRGEQSGDRPTHQVRLGNPKMTFLTPGTGTLTVTLSLFD